MDLRGLSLHLIALCLIIVFCLDPLHSFWQSIDEWVFLSLNSSSIDHPIQQLFWALANTKITDFLTAVFLIGSFILYAFEAEDEDRIKRLSELLYTGLWIVCTIAVCKLFISPFLEAAGAARESPSALFDNCHLLSAAVPWMKIKDMAFNCFPADHAVVVFQWCSFFSFFAGLRRGVFITVIAIIFLIPRLISGAHWISDIAVGSISVVFISVAWGLCSPLLGYGLRLLYSG